MNRPIYDLFPASGEWFLRRREDPDFAMVFPTKEDAVRQASDVGFRSPEAELVIRDDAGEVRGSYRLFGARVPA